MDSLPDAIVQCILSNITNAKDVASSSCVSKRWKESIPYLNRLVFTRNVFDNLKKYSPDDIVGHMVSSIIRLEELVVYCPFTGSGLASWLSLAGPSLRRLELKMDDNLIEQNLGSRNPSKLDCITAAMNLESLKLWGVNMTHCPKWDTFYRLRDLQIVGTVTDDSSLSAALRACPNLSNLLLLGCEGLKYVSIELPQLEVCNLDFNGLGNCSLYLNCPKIQHLEVQGCSWIRVLETRLLRNLSISNTSGRVNGVVFGKLVALESLEMRGVQWCWHAVNEMLRLSGEVKHLFMKVEFTGDSDSLQPFPEIDFVDFFNSHPKLTKFDIHGAMFAALCQRNSLKNVDYRFMIPCLEEVVVTVRSPLNAEQKMSTLESLIQYGKKLKKMRIKILQMKSSHSSTDDFFEEICRFTRMNRRIVSIE
ncbi:F-box protein At1g10780-like [Nicotiana tabacum]|uniref:F-box protein At1g10780-like n=1 Tax=Nicotiana tabacum TaxID=4097 RepID=A0A1S3X5Y1_TOBAC|nr:PREDICTED: F-box protein At1g10780-like [Nicotiana tabacum]